MKQEHVVVLGASPNPERYSNQAVRMLLDHGHRVTPVHPAAEAVHGAPCVKQLSDVKDPVDTLTVYVSPELSSKLINAVIKLAPKRLILNPGTENPELETSAKKAGIRVLHACTLVLLSTSQF